jgi:putative membrane protein
MFNGLCHFGNWGSFGTFGTWGWVAMILQMVFWLGLIAGVVLLVVWAIRRSGQTSLSSPGYAISGQPTAKDVLQARYARGEITREQYQQIFHDLG